MAKIKSMRDLREQMLQVFDDLKAGKIDISEAVTCAKISETVIAGLKSEMQYAVLTNQQPCIEFYGDHSGIPLERPRRIAS